MSRIRLRRSTRSFWSGLSLRSSTPALSASCCRAPRLSVFSISSTNVKTSPERSQPKQYHDCICGLTLKLGLSSWWKGHRPQKSLFRFVSRTCSDTTLTRSTLAFTSAKASSDAWVGTVPIVRANGAPIHRLGKGGSPGRRVCRGHDRAGGAESLRHRGWIGSVRLSARLLAADEPRLCDDSIGRDRSR